jgi:hypothetical protein
MKMLVPGTKYVSVRTAHSSMKLTFANVGFDILWSFVSDDIMRVSKARISKLQTPPGNE